jgi:hypothetical protein
MDSEKYVKVYKNGGYGNLYMSIRTNDPELYQKLEATIEAYQHPSDKKEICGCTGLECIKCVFGACGFRREEDD